MKQNLVARTLKKIAPKIGVQIVLEPKWGVVGQIKFASGRKRYFRYSTLDLNHVGASDIARDKDYSKFFMKKMGYSVIPGKVFCSKRWAEILHTDESMNSAYKFAQKLGWPVVVKPNSQSQGRDVFKVHTRREFEIAFRRASQCDKMILVEKFVTGRDYRLVVLDDKVISAYERIPLSVVGDGQSSIRVLLEKKQEYFKSIGRDTVLRPNDIRIKCKLARRGLTLDDKIFSGERMFLLDNANLSSGGDSNDVTERVHKDFKNLAVRLTKDMGLRLCGVDLLIGGSVTEPLSSGKYWIIEINAAPGLDHYATIGKKQQKIVEDLYTKVLKAMDVDS